MSINFLGRQNEYLCILPNSFAQSTHETNRNQMKNLLRHIISPGIPTSSFSEKLSTSSQSFLQPNAQLIETFSLVMIDQINVLMILHLWLSCLTLRHGQESVERGFSVNKAIIIDNISPGCIVGKGLVRDYMLTNNLKPLNVQITSNLKVPF